MLSCKMRVWCAWVRRRHEHFASLAALGTGAWVDDTAASGSNSSVLHGRHTSASDVSSARAARARAARLHHIVGRFNEWLKSGGKGQGGLVRGGVVATVIDPSQPSAPGSAANPAGHWAQSAGHSELVAVASYGLREGEMFALSSVAVMDGDTAFRAHPIVARGVLAALTRAEAASEGKVSSNPADWFTAKDQALALHLVTEALRQPHPLADALRAAEGAPAPSATLLGEMASTEYAFACHG